MSRLLLLFLCLWMSFAFAQSTPIPRESQLKAVYLYRFTIFIDWPPEVFANDDAPLLICIIGDNPFGNALNLAIDGERYQQSRSIAAVYRHENAAFDDCHAIYLSDSVGLFQEEQLLRTLTQKPVLLVSGKRDFVRRGGMIEFYNRGNKVRFLIDPKAFKDAGLRVSANLLRVGDVVDR